MGRGSAWRRAEGRSGLASEGGRGDAFHVYAPLSDRLTSVGFQSLSSEIVNAW